MVSTFLGSVNRRIKLDMKGGLQLVAKRSDNLPGTAGTSLSSGGSISTPVLDPVCEVSGFELDFSPRFCIECGLE